MFQLNTTILWAYNMVGKMVKILKNVSLIWKILNCGKFRLSLRTNSIQLQPTYLFQIERGAILKIRIYRKAYSFRFYHFPYFQCHVRWIMWWKNSSINWTKKINFDSSDLWPYFTERIIFIKIHPIKS